MEGLLMPTIDNRHLSPDARVIIDAIDDLTPDELLDLQEHALQGETIHLYVTRATAWLIAHGKVVI